ncbi:MAG: hypothetical protein IT181_25370 [Acidobacteria bacterium]|nr:hypothetical protein [Acidobacteriota bacterium]
MHAHNCYPDEGRGGDRLARALAATRGTVAIEQDVAWDARRRQPVVSHDAELDSSEPTLETHFFDALAPRLDRALAARDTATWPLVVLHLDFKTNEPEHHAAIWALLGRDERWLTTAPRVADGAASQPLTPGPLLVLTEQGTGQEALFHDAVPQGERLRLFGTVPAPAESGEEPAAVRMAQAVAAAPDVLIPSGATNYRRWTNHSWAVVEAGGPPRAGSWTAADQDRLRALVARAHALGLWLRFYTLNGHGANDAGWSDGYNFGALDAVRPRWQAAIDAGVDFIATDQYEAFSDTRAAAVR